MTDSASRDAHAETNAHHASVCKSCAMSCATGKPASCQGTERLARVELGLKRLHLAVWITLVVLVIVLAFMAGQRTQSRNPMMQGRPNENGDMGRRNQLGPNGMPGSMRGMNGNPNGNPNGNFEVRIERYENDNDDGPNDDQQDGDSDHGKPKKRMSNDGAPNQNSDMPPRPPMPPTGAK